MTTTRRNPGPRPILGFPLTRLLAYPLTREDVDTLNAYLRSLSDQTDALNKFLKKLTETQYGNPQPHASTHMKDSGVVDSISGTGTPSAVDFGTDGDAGDATLGFAPFNHDHPASSGLASLEGLSGVTTDEQYGAHVEDVKVRRLLEDIVLVAGEILEAVE